MSSPQNKTTEQQHYLAIDQLQIGIHICLDMAWVDHNFTSSNFTIKTTDQIKALKAMKLGLIRFDPLKSTVNPLVIIELPLEIDGAHTVETIYQVDENNEIDVINVIDDFNVAQKPIEAKSKRVAHIKLQREAAHRVEKQFSAAASTVKSIDTDIFSQPERTVHEASELIVKLSSSMTADMDMAIHVMNEKAGTEELYYPALNTAVLCLMLGKKMDLSPNDLHTLGLGALFHDIGTLDLPSSILLKKEALTKVEIRFYQQHVNYGVKIGRQALLPERVIEIIQNHHEHINGSGYPNGLLGGGSLHARIVGLVSAYDDLCNQNDSSKSLTPHEALSTMFRFNRGKYDIEIFNTFIRCMGVYPPGTLALLSDGTTCIVTSVNYNNPLKPIVLVYHPEIAKKEARILDLEQETTVSIASTIEPSSLSKAALEYLSPRSHFV